ncbi:MAG: hypothetical protein A2140_03940 [Candidatus Muproteobacteria bacterium RBG_16_62_13]|uniref:Glycerophosphoryl diester phosphodiesterase membrane domain-containing protein n=1 Tax=Candidatus Muproteobacteria bacterium RBG_16_62_13 TaxID=1817756 RepID=A0A1F6T1I9_9PROT|nr:MAG: hypothetical protein A2140_03940 [Candidatus Muproteobacteria bacterium RBG_16_62_13]
MWLLIGLVYLMISSAAQFVPFLGGLIAFIIAPIFTAGLMYTAREAGEGREIRLDYLFQGFRETGRAGPLFGLGGVYLGSVIGIVALCAVLLIMTGSMPDLSREAVGGDGLPDAALLNILLVVMIGLALFIPVLMALYFATPLVMFHGTPVWTALGSSLRACLRNFWPLTVFGLVLFVLLLGLALILVLVVGLMTAMFATTGSATGAASAGVLAAVVLGMLLMFLISIPLVSILTGMNFCSYRSVYGGQPENRGAGMAG